jgi:uncharacterized RDD family membrane protein YckC
VISGTSVRRPDDAGGAARVREILTPEGIPLRFQLATAADRAGGFLIDSVLQGLAIAALLLALWVATRYDAAAFGELLAILLFLVPNLYFTLFELRWQGATPGKRLLGIRVIDARGGQLENGAVLARNLVRELEVWVPLRFLVAGGAVWPGAPGWAQLAAGAWTLVFLLLPLLNADRLRVGDLIAGTRVVVRPKVALMPDLALERAAAPGEGAAYAFTARQLGVYGIYELQVLEGLLRRPPGGPGHDAAVAAVVEKIQQKLGYTARIDDGERFLRDLYAALRRHLEQRLLFGERREDKHAR